MVFRFATFDVTAEDVNPTFFSPSPSTSSSTKCRPFGCSWSCTRSFAVRVTTAAAAVSQLRNATAALNASRRNGEQVSSSEHSPTASSSSTDIDLHLPDQGQFEKFTFEELQLATNNFSFKNMLGQGGYGMVFKGHLSSDHLVAIKRCSDLRAEVQVGRLAMHRNVLPLIGFVDSLLVYPLMINGSLASHSRKRPLLQPPLHWSTQKQIALGVAKGLSYLHDDCNVKIIHRDINPANILLDENFEPRIADFGMARFTKHESPVKRSTEIAAAGDHSSTAQTHFSIGGTYGYVDPHHIMCGQYSETNDIFAYGVTLLELITSLHPADICRLARRKDVTTFVRIKAHEEEEEFLYFGPASGDCDKMNEVEKLIKLALLCIQESTERRPSMSEVVRIIQGGSLDNRWKEFQQEGTVADYQWSGTEPDTAVEELSGPR